MKKFLTFAAVLLFLCSGVSYAGVTATVGDKNSSNNYRMTVDTNGTVTFQVDDSILYPGGIVTSVGTGITNLTKLNSGQIIATSVAQKFNLPLSEVGLAYTLITTSGVKMTVDSINGGDILVGKFGGATMAPGDSILVSTPATGDTVSFYCPQLGKWVATEVTGTTWTNNTTN